jgi:hypothetical protein
MCKCLWVLACANLFTTTAAYSAEWSLTSTLNPSAKYDDNVFMSENEQSSVQYSITPTLMAKRAMKTSEVSLAAGYNVQRYTAFAQLDRQDPFVRFNSRLSTERNQYGLAASYSQSSSRSTAEQDTGDFMTESSVTSETISPSYSYQMTARDSISLGANYSTRTYSTTDFSDNKTKSVNFGWQHQLSERLSGGLNFSASNYQSDGLTLSSNDDNYNLSTTITYKLSELWQLNGSVGVRKLNSHRTDGLGASVNSSSSGSSFDFSANRITELGSFSMGLSRSLSPSNNGDVNEQDRLTIAWSKALTELLSTSLSASYQQSTSALVEGSDKRENINFSPSIKWQLERDLGLNLSYQYRQQKRSSANTNMSSNSLMMTLIYDWDGIRASR